MLQMDVTWSGSKSSTFASFRILQTVFCLTMCPFCFLHSQKPMLFDHIMEVLPTTLILLDDYVPENILIGLQCMHLIIQHSHMVIIDNSLLIVYCLYILHVFYLPVQMFQKKGLIDSGCAQVIYHALKHLTYRKEVKYVIPLYTCLANLLHTIEFWDDRSDAFEVSL